MLVSSESDPTKTVPQVEVEGSKKKRKRKQRKRGIDTISNEVNPDCLDVNSSKISPTVSFLTDCEKVPSGPVLTSESMSLKMDSVMTECGAEMLQVKETEKNNGNPNGIKNTDIGDDYLQKTSLVTDRPSDPMRVSNSESDPKQTASQVEVKGSGKNKKRPWRKRAKDSKSNEIQPNCLDGNNSNLSPSVKDVSFESCINVSSSTDCEKVPSHVNLTSENVSLKMDSVMSECGAELETVKKNRNLNGIKNTGIGDDHIQKTSCVTDGPSDTMPVVNLESDLTKTASQVEVGGLGKKSRRGKRKRGKDLGSNEIRPYCLDSKISKITPSENDASLHSSIDVSSLTESEKISSHVSLTSANTSLKMDLVTTECGTDLILQNNDAGNDFLQNTSLVTDELSKTVLVNTGSDPTKTDVESEGLKKKRKRKRKSKKKSKNLESGDIKPGCLDDNSSKITPDERDASFECCVDVSTLEDSEKISSSVVLTSSPKKRKRKRKNSNNVVQVDKLEPNCLDIDASKTTPTAKVAFSESCIDMNSLTDAEKVTTSHVELTSPQKKKKRKKRRKNGNKHVLVENDCCLQKIELEEPEIIGTEGKDNQRTENSVSCSTCGPITSGETNKKVEETNASISSLSGDDPNLNVKKEENHLQLCFNSSPANTKVGCAKRKLLILDLNGLLVDIVANPPSGRIRDTTIANKAAFKRPFCDNFLQFCFERFNVGVWSSRTKRNVDSVVEFLMKEYKKKLLFSWGQCHCTGTRFMTLDNKSKPLVFKELKKLWDKIDPSLPWEKGEYNESNTLLIDDSPYKALRNPPNTAIFPLPYHFMDAEDRALGPGGDLRVYLEGLASADNVQRYVEQNPFGQQAIGENDSSWEFYCKVGEDLESSHIVTQPPMRNLENANVFIDLEGDDAHKNTQSQSSSFLNEIPSAESGMLTDVGVISIKYVAQDSGSNLLIRTGMTKFTPNHNNLHRNDNGTNLDDITKQ